jgi:DNA-binding protein HU-beta
MEEKMANKNDIVNNLVETLDVSKKDANTILDAVLTTISDTLATEESVQFAGFGTFSISHREAREGINPKTQETIDIPAVNVVNFRAGKKLKDGVNPDRAEATPKKKAAGKKAAAKKAPAKKTTKRTVGKKR